MTTTTAEVTLQPARLRAWLRDHPRPAALLLLALYVAVWWLANSLAAGSAWWNSDDYSHTYQFSAAHHLRQGRPLAVPVLWLNTLEQGAAGPAVNILLRFLQGAAHACTAWLMALLLYRRTGSPVAWLAPAIWLLWPYNGESVLWRAAAIVPVSALLAVMGAWCIDRRQAGGSRLWLAAGMALGIAAPLSHQHGAVAGVALWLAAVASQRDRPGRREIAGLVWIAAAYVIGGLIGAWVSWMQADFFASRGGIAGDLPAKLDYIYELAGNFLLDAYSAPVTAIQVMLVLYAPFAIAAGSRRRLEGAGALALRLATWVLLLVAPFAPLILPAENPLSPRVYYMAPMLLVASVLAIDGWLRVSGGARWVTPVAVTALLALYLPFAQLNGAEMVRVAREDVERLARLAGEIRATQPDGPATLVFTRPETFRVEWDPYGVSDWETDSYTDYFPDSKATAFLVSWAFVPFVQANSSFAATIHPGLGEQCVALCRVDETQTPPLFVPMQEDAHYCVCPPMP